MAAFNPAMAGTAPRPTPYGAPAAMAASSAPAGTFAPGTKIEVGSHKVIIQKYFSEGGFAHVYLVKMPKPIDGTDIAVLKRVAVPDKESLANMRTEVETMKKLKGHRPIVTYYDSHASQLKGGGYEVFLLMEFCNGGGLIDFMNTRLQNRLTEPEILKIFSDVTEGVACMHYLKPPLLHRDLKVENVLISSTGNSKRFKLCDFGSTAPPRPAAKTATECRLIEDDVQKHTTLQYRSPEMIDVYRKQPIDEKSDIWALGVLLYKLCYYTTPFEEQGQLAILNASFKFPNHPIFSDRLKKLIASMLRENPRNRPNVYQVLHEACHMQGIEVPIRDIYAGRTESESRRNEQLPSTGQNMASPPTVGAVFSPPVQHQKYIPDVVPMRRGRPTTTPQSHVSKPSPSPLRGTNSDPFAALDSNIPASVATDEVTARFPSLDQFSLLHDQGAKFEFDATSPVTGSKQKDLSQRVTEKLADDAFVTTPQKKAASTSQPTISGISRAQKIISGSPALQEAVSVPSVTMKQPTPYKPKMVSEGTMTSPTETTPDLQLRKFTPSPVSRFPHSDHHRSASLPRNQGLASTHSRNLRPDDMYSSRDSMTPIGSLKAQPAFQSKHASSSRPSLEGGRPSSDALDPIARTHSVDARPRPATTYLESNMDYLRERESATTSRPGFLSRQAAPPPGAAEVAIVDDTNAEEESNIDSEVAFLRTMEDQEGSRRKDRRTSGGNKQAKRSSLPSLSGTKNLLAGKFGDAFKRFESNASAPAAPRTPSPLQSLDRRELTPIAGSEATDGRSDDGQSLEETEDMPPEMRRELERRRLSMEEKRVANAAAEYRKRLADRDAGGAPKSIGGITKAASIQQKVKNLLDENQSSSPTKKTAEGYGRYTDATSLPQQGYLPDDRPTNPFPKPTIARKPVMNAGGASQSPTNNLRPQPITNIDLNASAPFSKPRAPIAAASQLPPSSTSSLPHRAATLAARPSAPPKPTHLNSLPTGPSSQPLSTSVSTSATNSSSQSTALPTAQHHVLSRSAPQTSNSLINNNIPDGGIPGGTRSTQLRPDMTQAEKDDYIADFAKRYPSLSSIEMVERAVGREGGGGGR